MPQTEFLSIPASPLKRASPRARSHGDNVAALVDAASAASADSAPGAAEPRSKSEKDLGAAFMAGAPAKQPNLAKAAAAVDPNDPRAIEREVGCS